MNINDAKKIKIGNLLKVRYNNSFHQQLLVVDDIEELANSNSIRINQFNSEDLVGVLLTNEHLKLLNFTPGFYGNENDKIAAYTKDITEDYNFVIFKYESPFLDKQQSHTVWKHPMDERDSFKVYYIRYFHELQNLYATKTLQQLDIHIDQIST